MALPDIKSKCNGTFKPEVASTKFLTTPEINRTAEGAVASPLHTFPSISNVRTRNSEEREENKTMASDKRIDLKTIGKVNANGVPGAGEVKKATKVDQLNASRPSNPFAKKSSNQETPSLFNSLKKKADAQGKL